ncbi:MAG: alpha-ribazole phosphatase [Eubacteriales bacterium]|nr:alpha-ribazole phosphatase [Eubacteriales bacterium]
MRLYLVRHGETDLNRLGCYYGRTEAILTENGVNQAREIGAFFKEMHWDKIVVSPLKRTVQTAELVTGLGQEHFLLEDALMEQSFGLFEGKTYKQLKEDYPQELNAWNQDFSDYQIPGGESFSDVRKRVENWVKTIPSGDGNMLIVAHKGTLGHMLAAMLGMPLDGYWNFVFEQGTYTRVDLEDGYAILRKVNQSCQAAILQEEEEKN